MTSIENENTMNSSMSSIFSDTKDLITDIPVKEDENLETVSYETIQGVKNVEDAEIETGEWQDVLGSGALMKLIIKEGKPDSRPERMQKCLINYTCTLEDGTLVEEVENYEIHLGDADVVQGLDLAIGLMNTVEKCKLKIQPRLAYGSLGLKPLVASDTTVCFRIELLSVELQEDPEHLTIIQRKTLGNKKRERGNWWYMRKECSLAIQCYRRALNFLDEVEGGIIDPKSNDNNHITDSELQNLLEDRISVYNNMAAAQLKLESYDAALNSLQVVLRCQPDNVKALFRKAKVLKAKNDVSAAIKCLQKASGISPNNPDIQKELGTLNNLLKKHKTTERELARRMFSAPKMSETEENKKKASGTGKYFVLATVGASIAMGLLGMVAYRFKIA